MCCRGWVWGKWFFPLCPVSQLKDNPREWFVGADTALGRREFSKCAGREAGAGPAPTSSPPGVGSACRTTNPALFSRAVWVNPFITSCCQPKCWTQLPLAEPCREGRAVAVLLHHSCSSFSTSRPLLWHIPLSAKCWRHRREFWQCTNSESTLHLQLLIPSTAHSAVPLSEQMTGLIPQVFVAAFDNRLNTKRAAGIIWKKRKQLPGLNGCTVMLAACRLQHRKPPLT